jgi:hypothetical protein
MSPFSGLAASKRTDAPPWCGTQRRAIELAFLEANGHSLSAHALASLAPLLRNGILGVVEGRCDGKKARFGVRRDADRRVSGGTRLRV